MENNISLVQPDITSEQLKTEVVELKFAMELDEGGQSKVDEQGNIIWKEPWKTKIQKMYFKKNGTPTILYHGTGNRRVEDIVWSKFETKYMSDSGFHFGTMNAARGIFQTNDYMKYNKRIFSVIVTVENPLRISDLGTFTFPNPLDIVVLNKPYNLNFPNKFVQELDKRLNTEDVSKNLNEYAREYVRTFPDYRRLGHVNAISSHFLLFVLRKFGYDSLVYENTTEAKGEDSIVVLDKNQLYDAKTGENIWNE